MSDQTNTYRETNDIRDFLSTAIHGIFQRVLETVHKKTPCNEMVLLDELAALKKQLICEVMDGKQP